MSDTTLISEGGVERDEPRRGTVNRTCFVIMPFSETSNEHTEKYWTEFYEKFLQPALRSQGFAVHRSEAKTGKISKDIVHDLAYEDLVLAVLTDHNPNVWYELGVRHSCRLGTIMAIQNDQEPAFDVQDYGIIFYDENDRPAFEAELKRHIASTPRADSPVADFLNIQSNLAVNMAVGVLRKAVRLVSENSSWDAILEKVKEYQKLLPQEAQVSI